MAGDIPLGEEYGDELAACTCPEVENGALFLSDGDLDSEWPLGLLELLL